MDNLPIHKASTEEGHHEKDCTICQENYKDGEEIVTLPCGHLFHKECIWPWLLRHATCPTCRFQLETTDESPNQDAHNNNDNDDSNRNNGSGGNDSNHAGGPHVFRFSFGPYTTMNGNDNNNNNNNNDNNSHMYL